jgi:hypothetical protein
MDHKGDEIVGPARIGRVTFTKTGKSVDYKGQRFTTLTGRCFNANYYDVATREQYWISGCKKDGTDALYSAIVEVDEDVREEYWTQIRNKPEMKTLRRSKASASIQSNTMSSRARTTSAWSGVAGEQPLFVVA